MKTKLFVAVIFLLGIQHTQGQWWHQGKKIQGNGDQTRETRNTEDYNDIQLIGALDIELVAGQEGQIVVVADSNLQEYILTEVKGEKLVVGVKDGHTLIPGDDEITITIPFETLEVISLTGSGDIVAKEEIRSEYLKVMVTGSGEIDLQLQATSAHASITGSGDIGLRGNTNSFDSKITGSGDIHAFELKSRVAKVTVTGSGSIEVYASETLRANVPGSGDVAYKGNPQKTFVRTSGSGSVEKD